MSDIPLHNIRRQKPPERVGIPYSYNGSMPKSRRTQDSKRNRDERHTDNSDEEAGLLEAQYAEEGEYEELTGVMSPVRLLLPVHISHSATVPQKHQKEPPKISGFPAKDNSRTIPFNPSSKHLSAFSVLCNNDSF
jgi:phospholipid-translocating ATPase